MKRRIAAVILAAGSSSRMGEPKQLLRVGSSTLLRRSTEQAIESNVSATLVVVGAEVERMRDELRDLSVAIVQNPRWMEGIGTSIAAGAHFVGDQQPPFDALVLMTCDQPHVSAAVLNRLIAAYESSAATQIASSYADTVGVPALFAREYFAALRDLPAHAGAKELLLRHRNELTVVDFEEGAIDIDTPADYARLARSSAATS